MMGNTSPSHRSSSPAEGGALPSFQDEPAAPVAPPRKAKAGASSAKSSPNRSANHTPTPPPPTAATSKPTQSDGILLDFGAPEPAATAPTPSVNSKSNDLMADLFGSTVPSNPSVASKISPNSSSDLFGPSPPVIQQHQQKPSPAAPAVSTSNL